MDTDTGFANVRRSGRISNRKEHCVLCESGRCIEDQNNDDYYTDEDITSAEQSPKVKRKKARKPSTYVPTGKPRGRPRKHFNVLKELSNGSSHSYQDTHNDKEKYKKPKKMWGETYQRTVNSTEGDAVQNEEEKSDTWSTVDNSPERASMELVYEIEAVKSEEGGQYSAEEMGVIFTSFLVKTT